MTFRPFFITSGSGSVVYGVAFASSTLAALGALGLPLGPGLNDVMPSKPISLW